MMAQNALSIMTGKLFSRQLIERQLTICNEAFTFCQGNTFIKNIMYINFLAPVTLLPGTSTINSSHAFFLRRLCVGSQNGPSSILCNPLRETLILLFLKLNLEYALTCCKEF